MEPPGRHPVTTTALDADLTLHLCVQAWGWPSPEDEAEASSPWQWLDPAWRDRLLAIKPDDSAPSAGAMTDALRRSHRDQARPDLRRVHRSWLIRALQGESPAVRRLVVSPQADPPGEAARWVSALWTERLVGGEPLQPDDPPAIKALAGSSLRSVYRLCRRIGLAKHLLASERGPVDEPLNAKLDARLGALRPHAKTWAASDLRKTASAPRDVRRAHGVAYAGLVTIARLLNGCDPYRVRWALQHLPYPIAKRVRTIMANSSQVPPGVLEIESILLDAAMDPTTGERDQNVPGTSHAD